MSDSRNRMIAALQETVVPTLRDIGFSGSFPHFRRIRDTQIDLLTFQFNRYGGSFVVEIAFCAPDGFNTHWGKHIPPNEVQARDIHPTQRLRLGSHPPDKADHWFTTSQSVPVFTRTPQLSYFHCCRLRLTGFGRHINPQCNESLLKSTHAPLHSV